MSYCLNTNCRSPHNPDNAITCAACGRPLLLADRYSPQSRIGRGGQSIAVLAKDLKRPGSPDCIIKQIPSFLVGHSASNRDLKNEAHILSGLPRHLGIPEFIDFVEANGTVYLVEEFIDGEKIEFVVGKTWGAEETETVFRDLLETLIFLHNHGVAHCAICHANLIRRKSDQRIVLVDFGEAGIFDRGLWPGAASKAPNHTAIDKTGKGLPIAPTTDFARLAWVGILGLTGIHPFLLANSETKTYSWRKFLPQKTTVPIGLGSAIDRALSPNPQDRFATAADMLAALDQ